MAVKEEVVPMETNDTLNEKVDNDKIIPDNIEVGNFIYQNFNINGVITRRRVGWRGMK